MPDKRALIFGISGQDGSYLARFLLQRNYSVYGVTRSRDERTFANLLALGIQDRVCLHEGLITRARDVNRLIHEIGPTEIYNLAGPSSVSLCELNPDQSRWSILEGARNILISARQCRNNSPKVFFAGSGDCFGPVKSPVNETTAFAPVSAYGLAKAEMSRLVRQYRERDSLFCVVGILFNHESPFRSENFVIGKVVAHVRRILSGDDGGIQLGDVGVVRDWGWAPEYVDAMWRMLQVDEPSDFIIASGQSERLENFVAAIYGSCGLDWRNFVELGDQRRAHEIPKSYADPSRALHELKWQARLGINHMAPRLVYRNHEA